ncbi:MAG: hypothetical protein ACRC9L_06370 [Brevinema sp.]
MNFLRIRATMSIMNVRQIIFLSGIALFTYGTTIYPQDNVVLPDVQLSIGDQSSISTSSVSEALLKDRNPLFEQVYLEELNPSRRLLIQNTNISYKYIAPRVQDISAFRFLYGYYHQLDAYIRLRRRSGKLNWDILYNGFSRQYALDSAGFSPQNDMTTNFVDITVEGSSSKAKLAGRIGYKQDQIGFSSGSERSSHFIPIQFSSKYWINTNSFLLTDASGQFFIQDIQQNNVGAQTQMVGGGSFGLAYDGSFVPWNHFRIELATTLSAASFSPLDHATRIGILSEFNVGRGVFLTAGMVLIPKQQFYGWPELAIRWQNGENIRLNFSVSGDYDLYTADNAFSNIQVLTSTAPINARWIFRVSADGSTPFLQWSTYAQVNLWNNQRAYQYEDNFYTLIDAGASTTIGAGLNLKTSYGGIIDFTISYDYESIPSTFLLRAEHKLGVILGFESLSAGFRMETRFRFESLKKFGDGSNRFTTPLDLIFSQRIYREASLILEFLNILNTDIYEWAGVPFGGFQVRGGIQVRF